MAAFLWRSLRQRLFALERICWRMVCEQFFRGCFFASAFAAAGAASFHGEAAGRAAARMNVAHYGAYRAT